MTTEEAKTRAAVFVVHGEHSQAAGVSSEAFTDSLEDYRNMNPQDRDVFREAVSNHIRAMAMAHARILEALRHAGRDENVKPE